MKSIEALQQKAYPVQCCARVQKIDLQEGWIRYTRHIVPLMSCWVLPLHKSVRLPFTRKVHHWFPLRVAEALQVCHVCHLITYVSHALYQLLPCAHERTMCANLLGCCAFQAH